jgi:hypothetical protein
LIGTPAQASRRSPPSGSAFIRLLAALNDAPGPATNDAFAERLSQWFDWTDAIPLSAALDSQGVRAHAANSVTPLFTSADEREYTRVRAALAKLAASAGAPGDAQRSRLPVRAEPVSAAPARDFASFRQAYLAAQQAMETHIAPLRGRLRSSLTDASPALARLAALDAVMEQVIGAREHALLATVPRWLEQRFERLRKTHSEADADADALVDLPAQGGAPARRPHVAWVDTFCQDMRALLLAELDLRLQPVEGLLDALRKAPPDSP